MLGLRPKDKLRPKLTRVCKTYTESLANTLLPTALQKDSHGHQDDGHAKIDSGALSSSVMSLEPL